jgi:hypothetical protein
VYRSPDNTYSKADAHKSNLHIVAVLYLQKHRLSQPKTTFHLVVVDRLPVEAGIDPLNKLVDRDSQDNRKKVTAAAGKVVAARITRPPSGRSVA